jgi:hypothetical protein
MNTAVNERKLKTGDLSEASVQAWMDFTAMPIHERCLRLAWMAPTRAQAAVLLRFCERHRMTLSLGSDRSYSRFSAKEVTLRFGNVFGCSRSSIGQAMSDLLQEDVLRAQPHVDNVTRKIWLNWPALQERWQSTEFPEQRWLELHWIARNKAEMVVLHALQSAQSQSQHDGLVTLSTSGLERQYQPVFGAGVDAKAILRAIKRLTAAGLVEQADEAIGGRGLRLVPGKVEQLLQAFYQQDLEKLLFGRVIGVK